MLWFQSNTRREMKNLPLLIVSILLFSACSSPIEPVSLSEKRLGLQVPESATLDNESEYCQHSSFRPGEELRFHTYVIKVIGIDCFKITGDLDTFKSEMSEVIQNADYINQFSGFGSVEGGRTSTTDGWLKGNSLAHLAYYTTNELEIIFGNIEIELN